MVPSSEQAGGPGPNEAGSVEVMVLRALCLTVNVAGSVVKEEILGTLAKEHFSSPFNSTLFGALAALHERGEYVVVSNLKDELHDLAMEVPLDFPLDDLFQGETPKPAEVKEWINWLKDPTARAKLATPRVVAAPPQSAPPAPAARAVGAPPPVRDRGPTPPRPAPEPPRPAVEPEKTPRPRRARAEVAESKPRAPAPTVLSSEGEEWATYLQEVSARQGRSFETGIAGLDEAAGGLSPGLVLVSDKDSNRLSGFLKQLADQIAARSQIPCLYLSFALSKAALRVRTLARLSGVPAGDIEKGRIKKGSPEWESVERRGRDAAEWLKWIFVTDAEAGMDVGRIREMGQQLLDTNGASSCLIVLDSLESMGKPGDSLPSVVGGLAEVSKSLDALVIAGTANKALSTEAGVDVLISLADGKGAVQLEVIRGDGPRWSTLRFEYRPDIHRFVEQPAS